MPPETSEGLIPVKIGPELFIHFRSYEHILIYAAQGGRKAFDMAWRQIHLDTVPTLSHFMQYSSNDKRAQLQAIYDHTMLSDGTSLMDWTLNNIASRQKELKQ